MNSGSTNQRVSPEEVQHGQKVTANFNFDPYTVCMEAANLRLYTGTFCAVMQKLLNINKKTV